MKPLVIFGHGKIAEVAYHHITRDSEYEVVALTCDTTWLGKGSGWQGGHFGHPILPFEDIERRYPPESVSMFVAIGYHDLNAIRARKCAEAKAKGYTLISYVSPRADHGPWLEVGENCLILDGVGIQPGVRIGNNVFIWNNSLIGHHSTVHDHCWLAAGATVGGEAELGERTFVGLNATVGHEVSLGAECFLGAGTLVTQCASAGSVFVAKSTEKYRLESRTFLKMTKMSVVGVAEK